MHRLARHLCLLLTVAGCGGEGSQAEAVPPSSRSMDPNGEAGAAGGGGDGDGDAAEAAAGDGDGDSAGTGSQTDNAVIGSWRHVVGDCSYTNTFDASGGYTISSTSGERITADYTFEAPASPDARFRVDYHVTFDNNAADCEGDMIDETGNQITLFIEFPTTTTADVFSSATGATPAFSWQKI